MSDCSKNTFSVPNYAGSWKVHEMTKTCGTCASYYEVRPTMKQGSCFYDELDEDGCSPLHDSDEPCDKDSWEPRTLTLEERYQQLEQVAREMLETIRGYVSVKLRGADPRLKYAIFAPYLDYREQLEALGVSVDD